MPVDPDLQAHLARLANIAPPKNVQEIRERAETDARLLPRRSVRSLAAQDLAIPGREYAIRARLYLPAGAGPHPVTVYFNGGGFISCSIETHDHLCRELAEGSGGAVLSVDYRLLPESSIFDAIEDVYTAVCWTAENGAKLGLDVTRIAVAGDSAGAHLSLGCALQSRDRARPAIRAQLLFYPPLDFTGAVYPSAEENAEGFGLTADQSDLIKHIVAPTPEIATHPLVGLLRFSDLHFLPPTLVATAEFDVLRDEGVALVTALRDADVAVEHLPGVGMIHGYANLTGVSSAAAQEFDLAVEWLARQLG